MLLLKEKELSEIEKEDVYLKTPKKRIMPSRASYYNNMVERHSMPSQKDEYTIELIRGGKASDVSDIKSDLDINVSGLTEADLKQYETLSPNLMPSGATMRSLSAQRYIEVEDTESTEEIIDFKVNKKGLLMLMVYAAIIIGIFTFIIFNAVSLVNLMSSTGTLEQQLAEGNQNLISINEQIERASDPDVLRDKAINDLEMIEKDIEGTINL